MPKYGRSTGAWGGLGMYLLPVLGEKYPEVLRQKYPV